MANCKRKTANLFSDKLIGMTWWDGVITADERFTLYIAEVKPNTEYTASGNNSVDNIMVTYYSVYPAEGQSSVESVRYVYPTNPTRSVATFTTPDDSRIKYAAVRFGSDATEVMFNLGSTAFPYEPYGWVHSLRRLSTDTDTLTTLPADIYPNDTTATVGLKGNMSQTGTPTPQNPVMPQGCGDLETTGEHTGQYKIPISSANTTTPVYLGEVETTRKIKKYEFTGTESISSNTLGVSKVGFTIAISDMLSNGRKNGYCTHFVAQNSPSGSSLDGITYGASDKVLYVTFSAATATAYNLTDVTSVKTWLSQQYANGTPVTVWYVLATEKTGIVNEPLMRIGDYADEVSGITIPTIAGANTLSVDTTLQPSEITVNYKGWHPVQSAHEKSGNVMPAGEQKTVTNNGITFSSDGKGKYTISGTATAYASVRFNLVSGFTTPISVSNGGQGTLSFFNTQSDNHVTFIFYNGTTKVDDWKQTPIRKTSTAYNAIGNKYVDNVSITVNSGATVDMTIAPEFTNDGVLPSEYEPYWT